MDLREAIAVRIQQLCKDNNITPNKLATISGLSRSSVKSILNGASQNPQIRLIKAICDGLDISLKEFFSDPIFDKVDQEIK